MPASLLAEHFDRSEVTITGWVRDAGIVKARDQHLAAQRRVLRGWLQDLLGLPVLWDHPEDDQGGAS